VGIVVVALLPSLVKNTLGGSEEVVTIFLAVFSVGIAVGSGLAAWLAHGRIILLPTPLASIAMAVFLADIGIATLGASAPTDVVGVAAFFANGLGIHIAIDFFAVAVCGGLFVVPAFAAIQAWSEPERRARVIAGVNVVSAGFMVVATLGTASLQNYGLPTSMLFLIAGVLCFLAGLVIFRFLPTNPIRDFLSIVFRAFYRLEVHGAENFAKAGPNMIVALNHVSFLDAALALSIMDRDPVFAIDQWIARRWWVRPWLRFVRAMPLDPRHPLATRTLINVVRDGKTLVIFPEGRLTATGSLMKVYDGAGLVADKSGAMIVPVRIDGLEQTPFTRLDRSQVRRRWWPKVVVTVLEPVKLTIAPEFRGKQRRAAAGAALYQIMSDLVFRTTATNCTIPDALIGAGRKHGLDHVILEDPTSGELTYKKLLVGVAALGRKLMPLAPEGGAIGVLLPNANGAAVTVLGLMSAGRVPAMINFTAGAANILAACKAANVTTIVTSRAFVEKARLTELLETLRATLNVVMLEEVRKSIGIFDKIRALFQAKRPIVRRLPDDPAAILFTSGSEGTPKGVVLSHRNMLANAAQGAARIEFGRPDKVFNVLPVFHSFGLTVGLILPLVSGVRVYLYPSPLHYRIVPELIYASNATILFGTDTFLSGYARSAHAYDFRSLRYILAGAEPVKPSTRRVYMEKFGIRILEGYGVTETAPALALNTPMFSREGTVGRFLPGIEARLEPIPGVEGGGRLIVRGPNVMLGYFRSNKPGVLEAPVDGWHDTGDVVAIDPEGFVTIMGRAKRFAKIGGEMISLAAVEALAADLWLDAPSAVVAIPDERKGERLILLTEQAGASRAALQAFAKERGAPELMIPAEVKVVSELPLLGSGKVDHPAVARMLSTLLQPSGAGAAIDRLNLSTDASLMFPPGGPTIVGFRAARGN
jgi:acyl-[acyl-carrier-protein]-phospholipid O-acyltransferase/long-chain-fatty-acid--[acyl-carrier-protein] ligase